MPPLYIVHRSLLLLARLVAASVLRLLVRCPSRGVVTSTTAIRQACRVMHSPSKRWRLLKCHLSQAEGLAHVWLGW